MTVCLCVWLEIMFDIYMYAFPGLFRQHLTMPQTDGGSRWSVWKCECEDLSVNIRFKF